MPTSQANTTDQMDDDYLEDEEHWAIDGWIKEGKLDLLQQLLVERPNLVTSGILGSSFLSSAISSDNLAATRILLDAGADPFPEYDISDRPDREYQTTLEQASSRGNRDIWHLLLNQLKATCPADVSLIQDERAFKHMKRALLHAAECGTGHIVGDFLDMFEWDHKVISSALGSAALAWEADAVDSIMDRVQFEKDRLDWLLPQVIKQRTFCSNTDQLPVNYKKSQYSQQYRVVCRLIDGAGVDVRVLEQGSPLLREAVNAVETFGALQALLEKGADPNTQWENGFTALHLLSTPVAIDHHMWGDSDYKLHEEGIRLLVEKGASITIQDEEGATASHLAAERCDTAVFLSCFLPADADLLLTTRSGDTLLHYAAAGGKHETVQYLLSRGCFDVNATNNSGWTPILCALTRNDLAEKAEAAAVKSARLLLDQGADVKAVTAEGLTILHLLGSHAAQIRLDPSEYEEYEQRYHKVDAKEEEKVKVLDNDSSAAALAHELLSGPLELPSIQSPAKAYRYEPETENWRKNRHPEISWGGSTNRMYIPADSPSQSATVINDRTPLHWAAEHGAADVAKVLRQLGGADDEAKDSEGNMPWDLTHRSRKMGNKAKYATKKAVE